jgi:hypothetical protein
MTWASASAQSSAVSNSRIDVAGDAFVRVPERLRALLLVAVDGVEVVDRDVAQGAFLNCVSALAASVGRVEVQAHGITMAAIKIDETRADREFEEPK